MTENQAKKISVHFWLRRLHSLSGIFPIGAFLIEHMLSNALIIKGPEAYNAQIEFLSGLPYVLWLEVFFIYIPILYHAFYGFYVMFSGKNNLAWYPYPGNWLYSLQRWTGGLTFIYVMYHVYHTRMVNLLYGTEVSYARMQEILQEPWMVWFYLIGMSAAIFHFANGIWGFLISWGVTVGERAQKISGAACIFIGLSIFIIGVNSILALIR